MFKLLFKYFILDYSINNLFDKIIQNFNLTNPYKVALTIFDIGPEHSGTELKSVRFQFKNDMIEISVDQTHIDRIYLFQTWMSSRERRGWQIHVINTDGNIFHYPINKEALLYLL